MGSWRDDLRDASFRGVPFKVEGNSTGVGRRIKVHNYPLYSTGHGKKFQDHIWAQDLGAEIDSFSVTGYIIANKENDFNYFEERDRLIRALKTEGPGKLVNPFFADEMEVSVEGKVELVENITKEGGICKFTIKFVQFYKPIFDQLDKDFTQEVDIAAEELMDVSVDFLALAFSALVFVTSLLGTIRGVVTAVRSVVNRTRGLIASVRADVNGTMTAVGLNSSDSVTTGALGTLANIRAEVTGELSNALVSANSIVNSPGQLALSLQFAVNAILHLVGIEGEVVEGGVVGVVSGTVRGDAYVLDGTYIPKTLGTELSTNLAQQSDYDYSDLGSVPDTQQDNQIILILTMQAMMLANATRIAIRTVFDSYQEMEDLVQVIVTAIDSLLDRIGSVPSTVDSSALYQSVYKLRSSFVSSMYGKNTGTAREVAFQVPSDVMSSIELAYMKYDDIAREAEIFSRNRPLVTHPGFLPNGEEIRLLDG